MSQVKNSKVSANGKEETPAIQYMDPLAEMAASEQADQVKMLIMQRQQQLAQTMALIAVTKEMPAELRDATTDADLESNEVAAKKLKAAIHILREHKRKLLGLGAVEE